MYNQTSDVNLGIQTKAVHYTFEPLRLKKALVTTMPKGLLDKQTSLCTWACEPKDLKLFPHFTFEIKKALVTTITQGIIGLSNFWYALGHVDQNSSNCSSSYLWKLNKGLVVTILKGLLISNFRCQPWHSNQSSSLYIRTFEVKESFGNNNAQRIIG